MWPLIQDGWSRWPPNRKRSSPCCSRRQITANSPKSRLILSVTKNCDLWPKMAAEDGRQTEIGLHHVARDVELHTHTHTHTHTKHGGEKYVSWHLLTKTVVKQNMIRFYDLWDSTNEVCGENTNLQTYDGHSWVLGALLWKRRGVRSTLLGVCADPTGWSSD